MYRVNCLNLSEILMYSVHEEVRTTDLEHAMKVAKRDKTSGWSYRVEEKRIFGWRLVAQFKRGVRVDECGCRVVR